MKLSLLFAIAIATLSVGRAHAVERTPLETLEFTFNSVTGLTSRPADLNAIKPSAYDEMGNVNEEKLFETLFAIPNFTNNRVSQFISKISNEEGEPFEDMDDFQVAVLLAAVNNIDMREILTKPFFIEAVDNPGTAVAPKLNAYAIGSSFRSVSEIAKGFRLNFDKEKLTGPPANGYYVEGLLTTQGFARRSIQNGTNRRAIRAVYDQFLCTKIEGWKDASLDDFYVGKDVDRNPGENPETYQSVCRSCHAPMDAQRGALAHYDFDDKMDVVTLLATVAKKYTQNSQVFEAGTFVTRDASWENLLTDPESQAKFGWRGGREALRGKGLLKFSAMIANSRRFQSCMAERVLSTFCGIEDRKRLQNNPQWDQIVDRFREGGYRFKSLVQNIVSSDVCVK